MLIVVVIIIVATVVGERLLPMLFALCVLLVLLVFAVLALGVLLVLVVIGTATPTTSPPTYQGPDTYIYPKTTQVVRN